VDRPRLPMRTRTVETTVFCPACGVLNAVTRGQCRECAAELSDFRPPRPAPPPPPPACPACGTPMTAGETGIAENYRRWATFFAGASYLELFFRPSGERDRQWLMKPHQPSRAARCGGCGGLWIETPQAAAAPRP